MVAVIECNRVTKSYGDVAAVNDLSLTIERGEIFGLVGPNGAGKTTLIEMLESLRTPDTGSINVLGLDPSKNSHELHERIGVQLQTTSIQPNIKVGEALWLFSCLYRKALLDPAGLLAKLSLEDKATSRFKKLSGGQKQRVAVALALVSDPELIFFDEITTGLDPQARRNMWELVKGMKTGGKTVFLTTHYMEEAQELCDRVAVIDHGRIIALDTPENLVGRLGSGSRVIFTTKDRVADTRGFEELPGVVSVHRSQDAFTLNTQDCSETIQELVRFADRTGLKLENLHTEISNLDDVFLELTGKGLRE